MEVGRKRKAGEERRAEGGAWRGGADGEQKCHVVTMATGGKKGKREGGRNQARGTMREASDRVYKQRQRDQRHQLALTTRLVYTLLSTRSLTPLYLVTARYVCYRKSGVDHLTTHTLLTALHPHHHHRHQHSALRYSGYLCLECCVGFSSPASKDMP